MLDDVGALSGVCCTLMLHANVVDALLRTDDARETKAAVNGQASSRTQIHSATT